MSTTARWTETTDAATLARAFLFNAPAGANDLRLRLAKEYAAKANDVAVFWDTLSMYVGKVEAARLAA